MAILSVVPTLCDADPFSFSANGNYRENGGDEVETNDSFSHSYNLTFDKELSSMIDMSASARYNQALYSEGNDSSSFNPSANLDLRNDLFTLNLSGSNNHIDVENSAAYDNRTWGANLYSQLEKWPRLRLSYNQSNSQDDQRVHELDSESSTFGASVDYSLAGFDLLYDFRYGTADDHVEETTTDTYNHFAQAKYHNNFFDNRLSISASQQYSYNETQFDGPVASDGTFLQLVPTQARFAEADNTPGTGTLDENSADVVIVGGGDWQNIGVLVSGQDVDQLRVSFAEDLLHSDVSSLRWAIYTSSDNQSWTLVTENPTLDVSTLFGRTVVTLDFPTVRKQYVKVVIKPDAWPATTTATVTSLEAYVRTDQSKNRFISHQTQFSVSFRPTNNWVTGYSFRQVLNLPDGGSDNTQTTHSLNTSYSPSVYFALALGVTENRDDVEDAEDSKSRSYSVAISSSPLPTLDTSVSYTRTYNYEDGDETSNSDLVNGNLAAEVFPDLTVSFSPFWSRNQELESKIKTTIYGFTLNNNAQLTPRLNLAAYWNYARSDAQTEEEEEEAFDEISRQYGGTLSYRPSDILLLSSTLRRDQDEDSTDLMGNATWLITRNIQANGGVSFGLGEDDSDKYNASVNWVVSRNISLQSSGNYQVAETGDTWTTAASLHIHY